MRKVQPSSTGTLCEKKPQAASAMMAISRRLTKRISTFLSYLSASCPLVAENSRKGRMNSAPITSPAMAGCSQATLIW
jgi:hypothetical protein